MSLIKNSSSEESTTPTPGIILHTGLRPWLIGSMLVILAEMVLNVEPPYIDLKPRFVSTSMKGAAASNLKHAVGYYGAMLVALSVLAMTVLRRAPTHRGAILFFANLIFWLVLFLPVSTGADVPVSQSFIAWAWGSAEIAYLLSLGIVIGSILSRIAGDVSQPAGRIGATAAVVLILSILLAEAMRFLLSEMRGVRMIAWYGTELASLVMYGLWWAPYIAAIVLAFGAVKFRDKSMTLTRARFLVAVIAAWGLTALVEALANAWAMDQLTGAEASILVTSLGAVEGWLSFLGSAWLIAVTLADWLVDGKSKRPTIGLAT